MGAKAAAGRARVHCHSPAYPGNMSRFEEAA